MARQSLREKFTAVFTELGGSAGNRRLRDTLRWGEATYDAVKEELATEGILVPRRGGGGPVSLAAAGQAEAVSDEPVVPAPAKPSRANGSGRIGDLGFEAKLFRTADKLRENMELCRAKCA